MPNQPTAQGSELPDLAPKHIQLLLLMIKHGDNDKAILADPDCPYAERHYYRLKPNLQKYKAWYLQSKVNETVAKLTTAMPKAVDELVEELGDRDKRLRNKAANDILEKGMPKQQSNTNVQVNIANVIDKDREAYDLDE